MPRKGGLKFLDGDGRQILLGKAALETIRRHIQLDGDSKEAGGILLGRFIKESQNIVVDEATEPTETDKRGRFFFKRGRTKHQQRINEVWKTSKGTLNYLGEWHSHPEDGPSPSGQDLKNWKRIVHSAKYEQNELLFVIAGYGQIRAWAMGRKDARPRQLKPADSA